MTAPAADLAAALHAVRARTGARVVRAVDGRGAVLAAAGDPAPDPGDDGPATVAERVAGALAEAGPAGAPTGVVVATARAVHVLQTVDGSPGAYLHARLPVVAHLTDAAGHPAVRAVRAALADAVLLAAVRAAVVAPAPARPGPAGPVPVPDRWAGTAPSPGPRPRPRPSPHPRVAPPPPPGPPDVQPALAALAAPPRVPRAALAAAALAELTGPGRSLPRRAAVAVGPVAAGRVAGLPPVAWSRDIGALQRVLAGLHRLR